MEIEDMGELKKFETMPTDDTLYLTAITYDGNNWSCGPSSMKKEEVINSLRYWKGLVSARIYAVQVPLNAKGG